MIKIIRNKGSNYFVRTGMVATMISLIVLNLANIDRMVAVLRPAKLVQGVDYEYIAGLSNDAWEGWEVALKDVEKRIDNGEITSYPEAVRLTALVNRIGYKKIELERQSKNNWHNGGAWNLNDSKAYDYLKKNDLRLKAIKDKLSQLTNQRLEANKTSLNERVRIYNDEIRKILSKQRNISYNSRTSDTPSLGTNEFMEINVSTSVKQEVVNDLKQQISNATNKNCWLMDKSWATENFKFNSYSIMCTF